MKKDNKRTNQEGNTKSFAIVHWEEFEKLSMQILEELYHGRAGKTIVRTPSQSDGGFDGFICFPISPNNSSELYRILLEAKLRSSSKRDLPLSDFSKTIIIAINTIADKVYISTNAYFSAETNMRLKIYSQRTGLDIHTLDICSITSWINAHREQAEESCSSAFLDELISMEHHLSPEQRTLAFEPEQLLLEKVEVPDLIGEQRKILLHTLSKTLSRQNGLLFIQAAEGEGKSVFVENLVHILHQDYRKIAHLDLNHIFDIREVFIQLLSIAWGVGSSEIYGMCEKDLRDVTEYLGDQEFPQKSRNVLINLLHQPQEQFNQNRNLHTELLLDYLRVIFPPILKRLRCLIVISNLDGATRNTLKFLCSFVKILSGQRISFLIKIFNCEGTDHTNPINQFRMEIMRDPMYLDTISLPPWNLTDAMQFLDTHVPWLDNNDQCQLISFLGLNPLALSAGAEVIKNSDIARVLKSSGIGMPSLAARNHYTFGCIDHIVDEYAAIGGHSIQCSLILLGLLDGEVEIDLLEEAASYNGFSSPCAILCMCPFLRQAGSRIRVLHGAYQKSICKFRFVTKTFLYTILSQSEPLLMKYYSDQEYISRKLFSIIRITRNFERLRNIWIQVAVSHLSHDETELVYEVLKVVYEWWMEDTVCYRLSGYNQYWLLFHLTQAAFELYGADLPEINIYLKQIDTVLSLAPEAYWPGGSSALRLAKAETLDLKSQIALGRADYHNMLLYAEEGISLLISNPSTKGRYCLGMLWADKALALKHLENITSCVDFLESGIELLSGTDPFTFCYYTHMSSLYSVKHPRAALAYLKKVKNECECTLPQTLHTDHNIATMHFALGEYEQAAQLSGQVWVRAYENNVPIEEGRSIHLLGCIAWIKNDLEDAKEQFKAAYTLFQKHVHRTHLWPPLINLSTLCIEMECKPEALAYTNSATKFLLQYHLDAINRLDMSMDMLPKIYVGVLILLDNYERLDEKSSLKNELLEKINLPALNHSYSTFVKTNRLDELLEGTGYLCEKKRVLKI